MLGSFHFFTIFGFWVFVCNSLGKMSSESSSGDNSSSGSSSDSSSMGSPNARNDNLAPKRPAGGYLGPLRDGASEETDTDMKIMEEGEEGETTGRC